MFTQPFSAGNSSAPTKSEADETTKVKWRRNSTWILFSLERCVPQLVSMQAAKTPNALAVVAGNQVMSYQELDGQANQLAHCLRSFGVGRGSLVALCLDRSISFVVGALGIMKAGGAYLPLDSTHPVERLAGTVAAARAAVLVTNEAMAAGLQGGWKVVSLDREAPRLASMPSSQAPGEVHAEDLAYVIFTSGSTGTPKGVEITHANLLNLVFWHQCEFRITPFDRTTQLASPGFDAAVWELWPHLTAGASVHLPDDETRASPEDLRDWLLREKITISFVPTPLAERLISLQWPANATLRTLLTGADVLHRYPPHALPFSLVNNYGPTECTVVATSGRVFPQRNPSHPPTIGRPIANTEVWILGEDLNPVPPGTAGEIYIGGAGVGRGYLHQPRLTEERFIRNPFSPESGARLYKTGDLARWLPNGEIEFLERADHQVKIRGHRVELGEVEGALRQHPDVEAAVAMAREDAGAEKRLVAYLVLRPNARLRPADMLEHLQSRLPGPMIPSTFVQLDTLPLTTNGKVDRVAFPAPDESNILRDGKLIPPRTPVEKRLAAIVASILQLKQVGSNDDFFLLGGHSLLGMQLVSRIREEFGVELSLKDLFDHPSIAGISASIERVISEQRSRACEAVAPQSRGVNEGREMFK